jgi:hypothetical protein
LKEHCGYHLKHLRPNFLRNFEAEKYESLSGELLSACKVVGCKISLNSHFLEVCFEFSLVNVDDVSVGHGECFHQEIFVIQK